MTPKQSTVLVLTLGLLVGCAATLPTAEELVRREPGLAPEQPTLHYGRTVVMTQCAACHRMFDPAEYAPPEWGSITRRMGRRAGIGKSDVAAASSYLEAASRATRTPGAPTASDDEDDLYDEDDEDDLEPPGAGGE